ncbi:uncharacterized protein LOC126683055 isoform X4 [Mercurialis annua]|uniref:uncharacterized protein LOC126683055 isoform X4 n=1 Tax=Mercurialis annua TaxID=3986 RepID=UPI00215DE5EC|nr:uncharacterized protein LOC126683055 isoform X4 [Mercurialis annua]
MHGKSRIIHINNMGSIILLDYSCVVKDVYLYDEMTRIIPSAAAYIHHSVRLRPRISQVNYMFQNFAIYYNQIGYYNLETPCSCITLLLEN